MSNRKIIKEKQIKFQDDIINLSYKKIKNINLKIRTDGSINLSVPFHLNDKELYDFLESKKDWIIKNKSKFKTVKTINYVNGDVIEYLGLEYILKINIVESNQRIYSNNNIIEVNIFGKNNNSEYIKSFIENWYKENLYFILSDLSSIWADKIGVEYTEIKIRKMKSSWGICNVKKKIITYSLELAKKERSLIEYVVVHELIHLIHSNHGIEFKNLLYEYMPDWKIRKKKLNNFNLGG